MNRIKSGRGMLFGLAVFVIASSLTIILKPAEIGSLPQASLVDQPKVRDPIILEVRNAEGRMIGNIREYVRLRVYLSGRIEGDGYTKAGLKSGERERRDAVLDDERFTRLKMLLSQSALMDLRDKYPPYVTYQDTWEDSSISFGLERVKRIALTNPDPTEPENIANYPPALLNLLVEVDGITKQFGFEGQ
jgi:hypothetical protein